MSTNNHQVRGLSGSSVINRSSALFRSKSYMPPLSRPSGTQGWFPLSRAREGDSGEGWTRVTTHKSATRATRRVRADADLAVGKDTDRTPVGREKLRKKKVDFALDGSK